MIEGYLIVQDDHIRLNRTRVARPQSKSITIVLDYLAEGNANVLYRLLLFPAGSPITPPSSVYNRLLRLRKDKSFTTPTRTQYSNFIDIFAPLFPGTNLLSQSLIRLDVELVKAINADLERLESGGHRPINRQGDRICEIEEWGLLVEDMSPGPLETLIEVKPKWVVQSPNAAATAKRCRTCALRALRRAKTGGHEDGPDQGRDGRGEGRAASKEYCPLALMVGDEVAAKAVLDDAGVDWMIDGPAGLAMLFTGHVGKLLSTLRDLQVEFDPKGILALEEGEMPSAAFSKAMTLRDCTLFIKAKSVRFDENVDVRLADLDMKEATPDKVAKWRDIEQSLIDGGWYMNTEKDAIEETICLLSRPLKR